MILNLNSNLSNVAGWEFLASGFTTTQVYRCLEYNAIIYPGNNAYGGGSLQIPHAALTNGLLPDANYFNVICAGQNFQFQVILEDNNVVTFIIINDPSPDSSIYVYGKGRYNK